MRGLGVAIHEKALAVFGYVIREQIRGRNRGSKLSAKQRSWVTCGEVSFATDWDRGQHTARARCRKVSLPSPRQRGSMPPPRETCHFPGGSGKRGDVNLPVAGLVRCVGDPLAVGGNLAVRSRWTWCLEMASFLLPDADRAGQVAFLPCRAARWQRICLPSSDHEFGTRSSVAKLFSLAEKMERAACNPCACFTKTFVSFDL